MKPWVAFRYGSQVTVQVSAIGSDKGASADQRVGAKLAALSEDELEFTAPDQFRLQVA